mmetsp:Transcript_67941/g.189767  ORF Transcript_67941/g.189767 Transcript_67941/m.189767 type:complete len:170 (-) Transcript_67941:111-620(-)
MDTETSEAWLPVHIAEGEWEVSDDEEELGDEVEFDAEDDEEPDEVALVRASIVNVRRLRDEVAAEAAAEAAADAAARAARVAEEQAAEHRTAVASEAMAAALQQAAAKADAADSIGLRHDIVVELENCVLDLTRERGLLDRRLAAVRRAAADRCCPECLPHVHRLVATP